MITLIDWFLIENAKKIRVTLKNGNEIICSGNGLEFGEDIGEEEDMFFVGSQGKSMMIPVSKIEDVVLIEGK